MITTRFFIREITVAAAATLLCATTALAAGTTAADAQARYRQEMAACDSGASSQDPATCRLEARNALAEARRGHLNDDPGQYPQNALQRCSAHKDEDRTACEARMRGEGRVEGSVSGGGLLRESVTTIPAK